MAPVPSELFASENLTPIFASESDPVGGDLPMPRRGPLWLVPAELATHPAHEVVLEPPRYVSFDLIWRRDIEIPALKRLRRHVAATRGDAPAATPHGHQAGPADQTAVKSAGSDPTAGALQRRRARAAADRDLAAGRAIAW